MLLGITAGSCPITTRPAVSMSVAGVERVSSITHRYSGAHARSGEPALIAANLGESAARTIHGFGSASMSSGGTN
jgi:hypothetical protein